MAWHGIIPYRRTITITNPNSYDLTDYQVVINLDSTNFNFSRVKDDGSDIVLVDASTNSILPTFFEYFDKNTAQAKIWIKVPLIPANSSITVYLYYGCDNYSNPQDLYDYKNVFLFFDTFSGDSINTSLWNVWGTTSPYIVEDGIVKINGDGTNSSGIIASNFPYNEYDIDNLIGYVFEFKVKPYPAGINGNPRGVGLGPSNSEFSIGFEDWCGDNVQCKKVYVRDSSDNTTYYQFSDVIDDQYHIYGIKLLSINSVDFYNVNINVKFYFDGSEVWSYEGNLYNSSYWDKYYLLIYSIEPDMYVDWVRVRKFADTEPSVIVYGEESYDFLSSLNYVVPITIDNTSNSEDLVDYSLKIILDTASLITDGKVREDCGDIRFLDEDFSTLLPYWMDRATINTDNTEFYVKLSIPSYSSKTIYLCYGDTNLLYLSNPLAFLWMEDFDVEKPPINEDSKLVVDAPPSDYADFSLNLDISVPQDVVIEMKIYFDESPNVEIDVEDFFYAYFYNWGTEIDINSDSFFSDTELYGGDEYLFRYVRKNDVDYFYINDKLFVSGSPASSDTSFINIYFEIDNDSDTIHKYIRVDWIIVRPFVENEPNIIFGAEGILPNSEFINDTISVSDVLERFISFFISDLFITNTSLLSHISLFSLNNLSFTLDKTILSLILKDKAVLSSAITYGQNPLFSFFEYSTNNDVSLLTGPDNDIINYISFSIFGNIEVLSDITLFGDFSNLSTYLFTPFSYLDGSSSSIISAIKDLFFYNTIQDFSYYFIDTPLFFERIPTGIFSKISDIIFCNDISIPNLKVYSLSTSIFYDTYNGAYLFKEPLLYDDIFTDVLYKKALLISSFFLSSLSDYNVHFKSFFEDYFSLFSNISKTNMSSRVKDLFLFSDFFGRGVFLSFFDLFSLSASVFGVQAKYLSDVFSLSSEWKSILNMKFFDIFSIIDVFSILLFLKFGDLVSFNDFYSSLVSILKNIKDKITLLDFIDLTRKIAYALFLTSILSNKKIFCSSHSYKGITGIDKQVITKDDGVYIFSNEREKGDLIVNLSDVSSYRLKRVDKVLSSIDIEKAYINVDGRKYEYFGGKVIGFGKGLWGTDLKLALFGIDSLDLLTLRIVEGRRSK